MTAPTIDSIITAYQTRLAQTQAAAVQERQDKEAAIIAQATAALAEKFSDLWPIVVIKSTFHGSHSVNFNALVDECPCDLFVDTNGKIRFTVGTNTFYVNDKPWDDDGWGEFFTATKSHKAELRERRFNSLCNIITYASTPGDVQQRLANALAEFPNGNWQAVAEVRLAELKQHAEDVACECAQREQADRDYEALRRLAVAEAESFQPFIAYQLHYSVAQPGDEVEPYTTQTAYALSPVPDPDGWWRIASTASRGECVRCKFTHIARIDRLEITSPNDVHANYVCKRDYKAGVYIHRTPAGAQLLEKQFA